MAKRSEFDLAWQATYGMFRFAMWIENYGSYRNIDADFRAGKLDHQFKEWSDNQKALNHA